MKPELFFNWCALPQAAMELAASPSSRAITSCAVTYSRRASENAGALDNIKLKKSLKILLVRLTGTVAYNLHNKNISYKLSCKDVLLNGRITLDPQAQAVDYRCGRSPWGAPSRGASTRAG